MQIELSYINHIPGKNNILRKPSSLLKELSRSFTYLSSVLRALQQSQFSELKHSFQDYTQADLLKGTLKKMDLTCRKATGVTAMLCEEPQPLV